MRKHKDKKPLGRANEARRKAESSQLASQMRELHKGNAFGIVENRGTRRNRTRSDKKRNALRDFESGCVFSYLAIRGKQTTL